MPKSRSSIDRLPLPVKKAINDALKTGQFTFAEIRASIESEFGAEAVPSKSALGRYSQRFEDVGKRLRESREVATVWAQQLGNAPEGDVGKLVMELLRTMAFDATLAMQEPGEDGQAKPIAAKELNALALAIHRLETAGRHSLEREKALQKAAREEAAAAVEKISKAKSAGLSSETAEAIKKAILGVGA